MKAKAPKIIYVLSFIPLMWCVVMSIVSAGMGSGFLEALSFSVLMFTAAIPLFPVCLIVQTVCLIFINKKEHGVYFKRNIIITAAVFIVICGGSAPVFFGDTLMFNIGRSFDRHSAIRMLDNAEEKITYNEGTYNFSGVFGIDDLVHNTMLIDYDKNEVGFIYESGSGGFWKVRLTPENEVNGYKLRNIREKYFVQSDVPLDAPGKRLVTFCEKETTAHCTIAMILETEDGVFFADDIREEDTGYPRFSGFNGSDCFVGKGVRYAEL